MSGLQSAVLLITAAYGGILSWLDWRTRRLPNWLTLGGAVVALAGRFGFGGTHLFIDGLAAGCVGAAFLLLPFLARGAGGGDVKMMFAAGAIVGWARVLYLLWYTSLAGLALGMGMLLTGKLDNARLKHCARCLFDWRYDRKAGAAELPPKESEKARIPFSVAIAIGVVAALLFK